MSQKSTRFIFLIAPCILALVNYGYMILEGLSSSIEFRLNGPAYIEIPFEETYNEQGFTANYCSFNKCSNVEKYVNVDNPITPNTLGTFDIVYSLKLPMSRGSKTLTRTVDIVDKTPPVITLSGDETMRIFVGESYSEPGFSASDNFDGDLTEKVETKSNIDTNQAGEYTVKYVVEDSSGNISYVERIVAVDNRVVYTPSVPTTYMPVSLNTFDDLRDLIIARGYDMSFGYYRLDDGFSYTYRGDDLYYGASLIKAVDGMYAYEMTAPTAYQKSLLKNAIAYSYNDAHVAYVNSVGFENIHAYCGSLGSRYCLNGSSLVAGVGYYSDTTVNDQILLWCHLYDLIRNPSYGNELRSYYVNMSWSDVAFIGAPTHLHKAGILETGYHATSLFLASRPYILVIMSNENYRPNRTAIFKELSSYVYNIQQNLP